MSPALQVNSLLLSYQRSPYIYVMYYIYVSYIFVYVFMSVCVCVCILHEGYVKNSVLDNFRIYMLWFEGGSSLVHHGQENHGFEGLEKRDHKLQTRKSRGWGIKY